MTKPATIGPMSFSRASVAFTCASLLATAAFVQACGDGRPPSSDEGDFDPPDPTGGDGGQASSDAAQTDAPRGDSGGDGALPDVTLCTKGASWGAPVAVPLAGFTNAILGAVTPDELSIVWTTDTGGGGATIAVADRASKTGAFGAPQAITGSYAVDRATISSNGLLLVMVRADRRGFVQRTRSTRTESFGPEETATFANFDEYAATTMPADEELGDPLLTDHRNLLYSQFGGSRTRTIHLTQRLFDNDTWPVGQPIAANTNLDEVGGKRRRPTGLSFDRRTVFVYDETTGNERMGWSKSAPDDFQAFETLAGRAFATPNEDCSRLYFATGVGDAGTGGSGVAFVNRL